MHGVKYYMDAKPSPNPLKPQDRPNADDPSRLGRGLGDSIPASRNTVFRADLLLGQRVLIIGTGVGTATAILAAQFGADVAICSREPDQLEATREAILRLTGRQIFTSKISIHDPNAAQKLIGDIHNQFGGLDVLVNNVNGQFAQDAIDISRKEWLNVIDTDLNGTWWMMQESAKAWRAASHPGQIINIVANVERGMPQVAPKCAAFAGVIYLSRTLATEWAPHNIRVNCIAPGVVDTEMFSVPPEAALGYLHNANPMKTRGDAWAVAEAIVYLASPAARFINGDLMVMDGGQAQWGVVWPAGIPDYFKEHAGI